MALFNEFEHSQTLIERTFPVDPEGVGHDLSRA